MDLKLRHAGLKLRNLPGDDLSEAHIGLTSGGRAHNLDRFQTVFDGYFTSKLGYYPPTSIDPFSFIFERNVHLTMGDDFEALYNYLERARFAGYSFTRCTS